MVTLSGSPALSMSQHDTAVPPDGEGTHPAHVPHCWRCTAVCPSEARSSSGSAIHLCGQIVGATAPIGRQALLITGRTDDRSALVGVELVAALRCNHAPAVRTGVGRAIPADR